jgi:hypothetical protein
MSLLEPKAIPSLGKALLELLILFGAVISGLLVVSVSSIVGIIRAVRRRRRSGYSVAAVVLSAIATAISSCWLLYWVQDDLRNRSNPFDGLLAINLMLCLLPVYWLIAAIRANSHHRRRL